MFDWNGNGREDAGDWFIDYQIYNDIYNDDETGNGNRNHNGSNDSSGCGCLMAIVIGVILISMF